MFRSTVSYHLNTEILTSNLTDPFSSGFKMVWSPDRRTIQIPDILNSKTNIFLSGFQNTIWKLDNSTTGRVWIIQRMCLDHSNTRLVWYSYGYCNLWLEKISTKKNWKVTPLIWRGSNFFLCCTLLWASYSSWCPQYTGRLNYGWAHLHGCTLVQRNKGSW